MWCIMSDKITKYGDIGTPERHARRELISKTVEGQPRTTVKNISPIQNYRNKKDIDASQLAAGEKLYNSYIGGWVGFGNCEYREPVDGGGKAPDMTTRQVHAQREYARGWQAVGEYYQLVGKVVMQEQPISSLTTNQRKRKKMKGQLREALTNVAKVYGYC